MQKFKDIEYRRPDINEVKRSIKQYTAMLQNAKTYEEARDAILKSENAEAELDTMYSIASVRNTMDTTDKFYEGEIEYYDKTLPTLMPLSKKYIKALLGTPFRAQLEEEFGKQALRMAQNRDSIQKPSMIPNMIKESQLSMKYQKSAAACKVEFMGEECNFYGLLKHMESPQREERREAYLAWAKLYENAAPELDAEYAALVKQRQKMARKLGISYTRMSYLGMGRLDYTETDVAEFRRQVLEVIVPACTRIRAAQAKRIGVDKLKYYDEAYLFNNGNPTPHDTPEVMLSKALDMYRSLSPETGEFFTFMSEYELFDLVTRPGKHLGGYCTAFPSYKAPFIFSNFNGTSEDVGVLTHEAGHAFEYYTASRCQSLSSNVHSTSEINEIHSMAMEHFTYPYMDSFFGEDAARYRYMHLCQALFVLPYMMCVDEFQHIVYADNITDGMEYRRIWSELEHKYMPWRDYDGVEFLENGGFWMQKQHIFLYPFYYIDYALAQTCVFELYGRMKSDPKAAWEDYMRLCRAGGSLGYFELLKLANLSNPFLNGSVAKAAEHVIAEIESAPY